MMVDKYDYFADHTESIFDPDDLTGLNLLAREHGDTETAKKQLVDKLLERFDQNLELNKNWHSTRRGKAARENYETYLNKKVIHTRKTIFTDPKTGKKVDLGRLKRPIRIAEQLDKEPTDAVVKGLGRLDKKLSEERGRTEDEIRDDIKKKRLTTKSKADLLQDMRELRKDDPEILKRMGINITDLRSKASDQFVLSIAKRLGIDTKKVSTRGMVIGLDDVNNLKGADLQKVAKDMKVDVREIVSKQDAGIKVGAVKRSFRNKAPTRIISELVEMERSNPGLFRDIDRSPLDIEDLWREGKISTKEVKDYTKNIKGFNLQQTVKVVDKEAAFVVDIDRTIKKAMRNNDRKGLIEIRNKLIDIGNTPQEFRPIYSPSRVKRFIDNIDKVYVRDGFGLQTQLKKPVFRRDSIPTGTEDVKEEIRKSREKMLETAGVIKPIPTSQVNSIYNDARKNAINKITSLAPGVTNKDLSKREWREEINRVIFEDMVQGIDTGTEIVEKRFAMVNYGSPEAPLHPGDWDRIRSLTKREWNTKYNTPFARDEEGAAIQDIEIRELKKRDLIRELGEVVPEKSPLYKMKVADLKTLATQNDIKTEQRIERPVVAEKVPYNIFSKSKSSFERKKERYAPLQQEGLKRVRETEINEAIKDSIEEESDIQNLF